MANLQLIRSIAKQKGITIREIAREIGVVDSSLHHIMRVGETNTSTLEKIARFLGVPVGFFFEGVPDPTQEAARIKELEKEVDHLREILAEKERTIGILMAAQSRLGG